MKRPLGKNIFPRTGTSFREGQRWHRLSHHYHTPPFHQQNSQCQEHSHASCTIPKGCQTLMSSTCVNAGAAFSLLPEATLLVSLLKEAQNGSGLVIWCCHSHPISTFCSNWPKFREIQEFDTLGLGIPTVAFILILMVPLHAGLNSNMDPQDFLLCSRGPCIWWDIMSMLMLLYMEKKGGDFTVQLSWGKLPWNREIVPMVLFQSCGPFQSRELYPVGSRRSKRDSKGERDLIWGKFSIAEWRGSQARHL